MTAIIKKRVNSKMKVMFKEPHFPFTPSKKPKEQVQMLTYVKNRFGAGYYHIFAMIGGPIYYYKGWIR